MRSNSIYRYIKSGKLLEEIHHDGLVFLGNAYGYDVYNVISFAGAQELTVGETDQLAGEGWTRDENTFNSNIGDTLKLYFFVKENTNHVLMGCLNSSNEQSLSIEGKSFTIKLNYNFQNVTGAPEIPSDEILPLFFLPNLTYNGEKGLIIKQNELVGTYKGLINPNEHLENVIIPENVTRVKSDAFNGYPSESVTIENTVSVVERNAFNNYSGTIRCAAESVEDVSSWSSGWNGNCDSIVWGIHLTPEEIARREEEARLERERREREEREREEAERREREFQTAETISVLRYKKEGNNIVITGCKPRRQTLDIPEEIEGLPVTKIAPYAFYNNLDLTEVKLPKTVKEIGKAAFYKCNNLTLYYPATATLYSDALTGVYRKRII